MMLLLTWNFDFYARIDIIFSSTVDYYEINVNLKQRLFSFRQCFNNGSPLVAVNGNRNTIIGILSMSK